MGVHVEWVEAKAVRVAARHAGPDYRLTLTSDEQVIITGSFRDVRALVQRIAAAVDLEVAEPVVEAEVMCGRGCYGKTETDPCNCPLIDPSVHLVQDPPFWIAGGSRSSAPGRHRADEPGARGVDR
jgi:hypothetical protein